MKQMTVTKKNISMYPHEWAIVEMVNTQFGLRNTSAALRYIISQFLSPTPLANPAPRPQELPTMVVWIPKMWCPNCHKETLFWYEENRGRCTLCGNEVAREDDHFFSTSIRFSFATGAG